MSKGVSLIFGISLDVLKFFHFGLFFPFLILFGFCVFLVHPTVVSVLLSALVKRFDVSRMRAFFFKIEFNSVQERVKKIYIVNKNTRRYGYTGLFLALAEGFGLQQRLFSAFGQKETLYLCFLAHFRPF